MIDNYMMDDVFKTTWKMLQCFLELGRMRHIVTIQFADDITFMVSSVEID